MVVGLAEEAAAPEFHKHTAVFPGFSSWGWGPASNCFFVPAIFLRNAGKGRAFFVSAPGQ